MLCGTPESLTEIVLFRALQGLFGASLVPLSQATILDIFPPARRGRALAIWVLGVVVGPVLGPTLGGYLTDFYNWRWVFYINCHSAALRFGSRPPRFVNTAYLLEESFGQLWSYGREARAWRPWEAGN